MDTPKILVVMPMYNAEAYVKKAVDSMLCQTYPEFILLVINDGSSDNSTQIIRSYHDERIILWEQPNSGPGAAMNRAIHYAYEENIPFLARFDADDISAPERLQKQIELLQKHPQAAACSSNCYYMDAETEKIVGTSTVSCSPQLIHWEIFHGLRGLIQSATLFRTAALKEIGGYRLQFKLAEEVDVFFRLAERYQLINARDFLLKIRIVPHSLSTKNVHNNILYQFYTLDCAKRRMKNKPEPDFEQFQKEMDWNTHYQIWREENVLKIWRSGFTKNKLLQTITASLIDPRRAIIRILRKMGF
jgi:glycosyltransferase involved in cell wall biosynthesis